MNRYVKTSRTIGAVALGLALLAGCATDDARTPALTGADTAPPMPPPPPAPLSMAPEEVAYRAEAAAARDQGLPILIERRGYADDRFNVAFFNVSGREFRDIGFQLAPYDAGGRMAGTPRSVRFSGPVLDSTALSDGQREGTQDGIWTTGNVRCVEITAIDITFMNDERRHYPFDTVSRMYRDGVEKWCRFGNP